MNIINIEHISKIFGEKTIFEDASFGIHEGDKIGIIGINGTGKTTLLKMIAGLEEPDEGQIIKQNNLKIAYLQQNPEFPKGVTVADYAMSDTPDVNWKVQSNLIELGVNEPDALLEHLSGGQRRKVAMAKVLASDFDVLLLDEPTNHLDGAMITWLEEYLRSYRGTILMVTHDRYFLDQVTNRILEISRGKCYSYNSDYSGFLELKAAREEMELASERKRQSILRMEIEWAKRGCRARTTKQKARLERLENLKKASAPVRDNVIELDSVEARMGKKTIELHHVSKSFGDKKILEDYSYIALKNQRVGIIGPNGSGKSTLIKMLAGLEQPDSGEIQTGETIKIGYFAQEEQDMNDNIRVIDYVKDIAEYIVTKDGKISASQMLEQFLFTPDMQYAPIGKLSGGEKRRLYLLGVLAQSINLLLIDEPGNNLDIPTMTILEDYLNSFPGIVITVSHDRYFLDNIADRLLELDGNGHITQYEGGYTDYLEAKKREQAENAGNLKGKGAVTGRSLTTGNAGKQSGDSGTVEEKKPDGKNWKQQQQLQPKLKFTYKEQKEFETIDEDIAGLEAAIEALESDMMANATNSGKLAEIMREKEKKEKELEEKMDRWVYLNDLAERIETEKERQK